MIILMIWLEHGNRVNLGKELGKNVHNNPFLLCWWSLVIQENEVSIDKITSTPSMCQECMKIISMNFYINKTYKFYCYVVLTKGNLATQSISSWFFTCRLLLFGSLIWVISKNCSLWNEFRWVSGGRAKPIHSETEWEVTI